MKNLYAINSLYVDENGLDPTFVEYVYTDNIDTMFDYFSSNYQIFDEDLERIKENNGEIGLEDEDIDSYFQETIYGYKLIAEDISQEDAEKYVLQQFLIYT